MKVWRSKTPPLQWQLTPHLYLTILVVIIITISPIIEDEEEATMQEVEAKVHCLINSISFHNLKVLMQEQKGQFARFVVKHVIFHRLLP